MLLAVSSCASSNGVTQIRLQVWRWASAHFLRPNTDIVSIIHVIQSEMEGAMPRSSAMLCAVFRLEKFFATCFPPRQDTGLSSVMEPTIAHEVSGKAAYWLPQEMRHGLKVNVLPLFPLPRCATSCLLLPPRRHLPAACAQLSASIWLAPRRRMRAIYALI